MKLLSMNVQFAYHQTPLRIEEEWLMIQEAKENPVAFGPIYQRYYQQIFRYISLRTVDREQAADVTSQVFLKAMNHLHKYQFKGVPFASWLYRIAKSEVYQSHRDRQFEFPLSEQQKIDSGDTLDNDVEYLEERKNRLLRALRLLKKEEIDLIEMRFFERMSFAEIGEQIGLTENNAKVKTFRVVQKLKRVLAE